MKSKYRAKVNPEFSYKTRDGQEVTEVWLVKNPIYPVRAKIDGINYCFDDVGFLQYGCGEKNNLDLIQQPEQEGKTIKESPDLLIIMGVDGKTRSYPTPCRVKLKDEQIYYVASTTDNEMYHHVHWSDDECDIKYLERGIIHLTKEAAVQHTLAMLG